jgi:hypothetical protein
MKNNIDSALLESGHGFMVYNPEELVYDDIDECFHPQDSLNLVYSGKRRNDTALRYIEWQYMVVGATARELLRANEQSDAFWDAVDWFREAEIDFESSEYPIKWL